MFILKSWMLSHPAHTFTHIDTQHRVEHTGPLYHKVKIKTLWRSPSCPGQDRESICQWMWPAQLSKLTEILPWECHLQPVADTSLHLWIQCLFGARDSETHVNLISRDKISCITFVICSYNIFTVFPIFYFLKLIIPHMWDLYVFSNRINKYTMSNTWQEWN